MLKNRIHFYLVLGIVVGLFLTACAGVVAGKIDLPVAGGPFSPVVDVFEAPVLDLDHNFGARPDLSVRHEVVAQQEAVTQKAIESVVQQNAVQFESEHFCNRP